VERPEERLEESDVMLMLRVGERDKVPPPTNREGELKLLAPPRLAGEISRSAPKRVGGMMSAGRSFVTGLAGRKVAGRPLTI
jgi:hypothetical protein